MTTGAPIAGDNAMTELAQVVGEDAARRLALAFGGTGLYVPRAIGEHHPIRAVIDATAADRLAAWAGLTTLAIPKQSARRAEAIHLVHDRGLTVRQAARQTGYSERHLHRILREDDDARQPRLF